MTWWMTNDSQGEIGRTICLQDSASKGKSGRRILLSHEVRSTLIEYRRTVPHAGPNVISTERPLATSPQAIVNMFNRWYRHLGFVGCSRRGSEDLDSRRVAEGRPRTRRPSESADDTAVHRCQPGPPGSRRGVDLVERPRVAAYSLAVVRSFTPADHLLVYRWFGLHPKSRRLAV